MTDNDRLFVHCSPNSHRRKVLITDSDIQIQGQLFGMIKNNFFGWGHYVLGGNYQKRYDTITSLR